MPASKTKKEKPEKAKARPEQLEPAEVATLPIGRSTAEEGDSVEVQASTSTNQPTNQPANQPANQATNSVPAVVLTVLVSSCHAVQHGHGCRQSYLGERAQVHRLLRVRQDRVRDPPRSAPRAASLLAATLKLRRARGLTHWSALWHRHAQIQDHGLWAVEDTAAEEAAEGSRGHIQAAREADQEDGKGGLAISHLPCSLHALSVSTRVRSELRRARWQ